MSSTLFLQTYFKEILAALVTIVGWAAAPNLRPKARLVQGVRHSSNILVTDQEIDEEGVPKTQRKLARTAQVSFVNAGREPATDVQITFNYRPQHFAIWPARHYTEQTAPDDRFTLAIGTLPPKEFIAIDLLSVNVELPTITSAHCKECAATSIPLLPQEVHPPWKLSIVAYLMVTGFAATIYGLASIVQWLATK